MKPNHIGSDTCEKEDCFVCNASQVARTVIKVICSTISSVNHVKKEMLMPGIMESHAELVH